MKKKRKFYGRGNLRAKLIFDDGFAEKPIYSIKAMMNEKRKGFNMIDLIRHNFNLSPEEEKYYEEMIKDEVRECFNAYNDKDKTLKLNRDDQGNLISPFASKIKLR